MWYFIQDTFDGRPILILSPYRTPYDAEQAAARCCKGDWTILDFPTRDKKEVFRLWKSRQVTSDYNEPQWQPSV